MLSRTASSPSVSLLSVVTGLLAVGWGAFAYSAQSTAAAAAAAERSLRAELIQVRTERDELVEERKHREFVSGALAVARAQLAATQDELRALGFSREQWHVRIAKAQEELAALTKRLEPGTKCLLLRASTQANHSPTRDNYRPRSPSHGDPARRASATRCTVPGCGVTGRA
jgi:hypothetical protein